MSKYSELADTLDRAYNYWNNPEFGDGLPQGAGLVLDAATALRELEAERDRLREDQGKLLKCIEEMAVDIGHAAPGSESPDAPHWTAWVPEEHQSFITALQEGE